MKLPVYMDNHATTQTDPRVVEAMLPYFTEHFGNAASHQHLFGWRAEEAVEKARRLIAESINAEAKEIVFTSGATESNNLALKGIAEAYRQKGNHIVTSKTEHRSILDVCGTLERNGFLVTYLDVDEFGRVNPQDVRDAINENTIIVSIMMANNEVGTVTPVAEIGAVCLERGVFFHSDATQCAGRLPIDVQKLNVHLLSFSAHKVYGPKGIGALYVRGKNPRLRLSPQMDGGGHERGSRSGTLNVPAIVGFGKAMEFASKSISDETERLTALRNELEHSILTIEGARVNGHRSERLCNNISMTFPFVHADDLMMSLRNDVAISSGSACSSAERESGKTSHVLKAMGVNDELARCTVRIGLGRFNTEEEVAYVGKKIAAAVAELRRISPAYQMNKDAMLSGITHIDHS